MMDLGTHDDLWTAAAEGHLSTVRRLVEGRADIDNTSFEGMTPLHFATLQGHVDIVRYLVEHGAGVNIPSDNGLTPVMSACAQGFINLVRFLVQSGANVNAVNNILESPLIYLSKKVEIPARISFQQDRVHMHYSICHSEDTCGCLHLVKLLVGADADVNLADSGGLTVLMGFILGKHFDAAKFLIRSGADTNPVTKTGTTALLLACRFKYSLELIEMLLHAGADVNHSKCPEGTTPLMTACYSGLDNVQALIQAGAAVNTTNSKSETALKFAVCATNPSVIESLIKAGARIEKELILAIIIGHCGSIKTLIINGALPRTNGSMLNLQCDIEYLSKRFSVSASSFMSHRLLAHLETLSIISLTPFMVALMRRDATVARFLIRNYFFHSLDILLLQNLQRMETPLENTGLSSCFSPLLTQPWSLLSLSFLCVSFAVGFGPDREKCVSLLGLPYSLLQKFLYRGREAYTPLEEWPNLDIIT